MYVSSECIGIQIVSKGLSNQYLFEMCYLIFNLFFTTEELTALDFPGVPTADINLGVSRLHSEFEFLAFLGKGGFGNVIKVST